MKPDRVPTCAGQVMEFHRRFKMPVISEPSVPHADRIKLRRNLIAEECREADNEFLRLLYSGAAQNHETLCALAKELADILYVVYGAAHEFGIDLDAVFDEVHRSNMSKLGDDGEPVYREDGKVTKGPNYSPANIKGVLFP